MGCCQDRSHTSITQRVNRCGSSDNHDASKLQASQTLSLRTQNRQKKNKMELTQEEYILDQVAEINPDAIVLEPRSTFNRAIIGTDPDGRIVYSANKIINAFMDVDGMTEEEAVEYFEYNTLGTIQPMGSSNKPLFVYDEFIF